MNWYLSISFYAYKGCLKFRTNPIEKQPLRKFKISVISRRNWSSIFSPGNRALIFPEKWSLTDSAAIRNGTSSGRRRTNSKRPLTAFQAILIVKRENIIIGARVNYREAIKVWSRRSVHSPSALTASPLVLHPLFARRFLLAGTKGERRGRY